MLSIILLILLHLDLGLSTQKPINIYWNSTNPLFSTHLEPSIDVNSDVSSSVRQFDQINLICAHGRRNKETHIIYSVTRGI